MRTSINTARFSIAELRNTGGKSVNPKPTLLLSVTTLALTLATPTLANAPFFMGLGDFAGGEFRSGATAISADGSTVVGGGVTATGWQSFRWTAAEGLVPIGPALPYDDTGETYYIGASNISADGSTIVGFSRNAGQNDAWKWTAGGGYQPLNHLPAGPQAWAVAHDCSADGSVIVGDANPVATTYTGTRPVRWSGASDPTSLSGSWADGSSATAYACSADGTVVAGRDHDGGVYRWREQGGVERLDAGSTAAIDAAVYDLSADGSIAVGYIRDFSLGVQPDRAVRWDANGVMWPLPNAPDGSRPTHAEAVSPDGSVIVGQATTADNYGNASFVWDEINGTRNLQDVLENECGLGPINWWDLGVPVDIAADNLTIVGGGKNPDGHWEAYIARLPEPGTLVSLALITLLATRRRG
jgi:uncharacterized membrane protein